MYFLELNYFLLNRPSKKVLKVLKAKTIVVTIKIIAKANIRYANHIESSILFKALKAMFKVIGEMIKSKINTSSCFIPLPNKSVLMLIIIV